MPNAVILATGDFISKNILLNDFFLENYWLINVRKTIIIFFLFIFWCSIVPSKNAARDKAIKEMLKRNGAGPGHQLTPQKLPDDQTTRRPEVVTISPNNGKGKDINYIHQDIYYMNLSFLKYN